MKCLCIYYEFSLINKKEYLFIYNNNIGSRFEQRNTNNITNNSVSIWLMYNKFGKKMRRRCTDNENKTTNANNNNNNDKNLLDFNLKELEEAFNKYQELVDATYKKITGEKCKKGFRYINKKDGNYIMFSESENKKNINESGLDKFFELLVNLTASEDNSIFIIDYMLNMYQRKQCNKRM